MNILLAVTGSISCYKAYDLLRQYVKSGHHVRVITTKGAQKFIKSDLFHYLGAQKVYSFSDDFNIQKHNSNNESTVLHVDLGKWADTFIIAPLSANTLSSLAQGSAFDLLSSTFLAYPNHKPIILFPAMNTQMLSHPFVKGNLKKLNTLENTLVAATQNGQLVCGDQGEGKLLEVEEIFNLTETYTLNHTKKDVLITTGATIAPLDPVRFLTNASSGKTGFHLAKNALSLGHKVTMIAGQYATSDIDLLINHPNFTLLRVVTTQEMKAAVTNSFSKCDIYISSAAIGDIEFLPLDAKLKKSEIGQSLPIKDSSDILSEMIQAKKPHQKIVGFAAETNISDNVIKEKMMRKPVDLLIATKVHHGLTSDQVRQGFGSDEALYRFTNSTSIGHETLLSKKQLAHNIFTELESL